MITSTKAQINAQLSRVSYGDRAIPAGYQRVQPDPKVSFDDPLNGFHAEIYLKTGTSEYVIAFTGSQNGQDWAANTSLGTRQWRSRNKDAVLAAIAALPNATNITFTGHSLGGALAQYAAYDYAVSSAAHLPISLVTFNALGGMAGLQQLNPGAFNPAIASQIDGAHFVANSSGKMDVVSRLGGGHFGGSTYQINASANLGLVDTHNAWSAFEALTVPVTPTAVQYLNTPWAQKIATVFAYLGDDGKIDDMEGWTRAAGGVLVAAALAPTQEINQISEALLPGASTINLGVLRDSNAIVRLELALSGFVLLGFANATQLASQTNEVAIKAVFVANRIAHAAYDLAVSSGSSAVNAVKIIYDEATRNVLRTVSDYLNTHPSISSPRNTTIFDLSVDPTSLRPNNPNALGSSSNGWGLVGSGASYSVSLTADLVNDSGGRNVAAGYLTTGGPRPGNHNLYDAAGKQIGLATNDETWRISAY